MFAGASIEQGNVLYLDVMPLRARRSASDEDRRRKTSARRCGEACQYRLYDHDHDEELIINLTRWRQLAKPRNSSLADLSELVVPIVQYIDTDNATRARVSTADRGCLYSALVVGSSTSTILNLCDSAGGLFGSLALPDGTYMIEPIGGLADTDSRTRRKGGRKPHLLYKARSHAFHRYDDVSILRQTNPTDSLPSADDDYHRLDDYNTVNDADNDDPDWIEEDYRLVHPRRWQTSFSSALVCASRAACMLPLCDQIPLSAAAAATTTVTIKVFSLARGGSLRRAGTAPRCLDVWPGGRRRDAVGTGPGVDRVVVEKRARDSIGDCRPIGTGSPCVASSLPLVALTVTHAPWRDAKNALLLARAPRRTRRLAAVPQRLQIFADQKLSRVLIADPRCTGSSSTDLRPQLAPISGQGGRGDRLARRPDRTAQPAPPHRIANCPSPLSVPQHATVQQ
uniref:Peptidase M12B propeptide domain-containing protein n=1 Tax=Plectus sambesii TaxID=2011161 RepID=A0A914WUY0_9BILA